MIMAIMTSMLFRRSNFVSMYCNYDHRSIDYQSGNQMRYQIRPRSSSRSPLLSRRERQLHTHPSFNASDLDLPSQLHMALDSLIY